MKWPKTEKEIDALLDEPVMEYTEEEIERHVDRIVAKIAVIRRAKTAAKFVRVVRRPLPTNPGAPKP